MRNFDAIRSNAAVNALVRREQAEECLRHAPKVVIGGLVNATILAIDMWSPAHALPIILWVTAIFALGGIRFGGWWRHRALLRAGEPGDPTIRPIVVLAALNGVLWGVGIAAAATVAGPLQFDITVGLSAGMMGAAVLTYGSLARAALAFTIPVAAGAVAAWFFYPLASPIIGVTLVINYMALLVGSAISAERLFIRRVIAREDLRESVSTVQLLLHEFETQSSDWLWEVDAQGGVVAPSPRFCEAAAMPRPVLDGYAFTDLFEPGPEYDGLAEHIRRRLPFRGLTLRLDIAGETHWWMLSARPMPDTGLRGVASDITARKRAEERVHHLAHYDGLTNLANRTLFRERLHDALRRHGDALGSVAVLYLDLDRFKSVNDTLGHPMGDKLLCEVSRRIEQAVCCTDLVARLGGDEFAILLQGPQVAAMAESVAERVIEALGEPCLLDGLQVLTGTSIGIAVAGGEDGDATTLMKRADLALYSAKTNGRNRFAHFVAGMDEAARERRQLELDLRQGLAAGQFELAYQPVRDIAQAETVCYEALLRWRHPTRGLVMPGTFIPLAEETGLIVPLGAWVLRQAIADLATWPAHLGVAVNLSPVQMRDGGLIVTVMQALAAAGIDPRRLTLEITESVLLRDSSANVALLHRLRDLGVGIALDDFGTGYSSLNYLRSFPFEKIKIDRSFVEGVDQREDSRTIVQTVIALARALGMVTIAEGVERVEQLEWLRAEGCLQAQGYLFGRPARADDPGGPVPRAAGEPVDEAEASSNLVALAPPAVPGSAKKSRTASG